MKIPNFLKSHNKQFNELLKIFDRKKVMSLVVGGDFNAVGILEFSLLRQHGLQKLHTIIDVGCGSGRLAFQLREFLEGQYVGIDVVPELYQYAKQICKRPDWKFLPAPGLTIPMDDNFADFVCFFSVFTHLLHEESYKYLVEAKRVLKPGGKIVFSFLEFAIPYHWAVFESTLGNDDPDKVLNQFMSRDAITAWAEHLDLQIVELADGDKPYIQLDQTIRFENGKEMTGKGNLNQSICVLTKRTP